MATYTKDITTLTGKIRYLVGDTDMTSPNFSDEELQGFYSLTPDGSIYLACALALDSLASSAAINLTNVTLGTLKIDETSKVEELKLQAARFRDLEYNTPAFAVVEENLSSFNELGIIRNFILRTEG
jgi:hypothetical protein